MTKDVLLDWSIHLKWWAKVWSVRRQRQARRSSVRAERWLIRDPDIDSHAVLEVLIPRDEGVALFVLKADAIAVIQAIEVLDCSNDRVCRIMRVDVDSHG